MESRKMITDCLKCSSRFDMPVTQEKQWCDRCMLLYSSQDVYKIILELRKHRVPGQEPILRLFELLNEKITDAKKT